MCFHFSQYSSYLPFPETGNDITESKPGYFQHIDIFSVTSLTLFLQAASSLSSFSLYTHNTFVSSVVFDGRFPSPTPPSVISPDVSAWLQRPFRDSWIWYITIFTTKRNTFCKCSDFLLIVRLVTPVFSGMSRVIRGKLMKVGVPTFRLFFYQISLRMKFLIWII